VSQDGSHWITRERLIMSIAVGFGLPFGVAGKLLSRSYASCISLIISFSLANVQEQIEDDVGWHRRLMGALSLREWLVQN